MPPGIPQVCLRDDKKDTLSVETPRSAQPSAPLAGCCGLGLCFSREAHYWRQRPHLTRAGHEVQNLPATGGDG